MASEPWLPVEMNCARSVVGTAALDHGAIDLLPCHGGVLQWLIASATLGSLTYIVCIVCNQSTRRTLCTERCAITDPKPVVRFSLESFPVRPLSPAV
jgi:hypothetical protein